MGHCLWPIVYSAQAYRYNCWAPEEDLILITDAKRTTQTSSLRKIARPLRIQYIGWSDVKESMVTKLSPVRRNNMP